MSRVHPQRLSNSITCSSEQQVFTLWMKSLIFSSNGCVAFDSSGKIAYRVDNYDRKCRSLVHIMDTTGKVLFTIVKKKFSLLGTWEGYRSPNPKNGTKPEFRVTKLSVIRRILGCLGRQSFFRVLIGGDKNEAREYVIESEICKSCFKILDEDGGIIAEVKRKVTSSGVVLGEDVLTMVVEPHIDHSLIIGLVVVFGLVHGEL